MHTRLGRLARRKQRHGAHKGLALAIPVLLLLAALISPAIVSAANTGYLEGTTAAGTCGTPSEGLALDGDLHANCDDGETLIISGFNLQASVPSDATDIQFNVEVEGADGENDNEADIDLSWNAGTNYTTQNMDTPDFDSETDVVRFVPSTDPASCSDWGRTWTWAELSDANFRLRATAEDGHIDIDRIRIDVCYTAAEPSPSPSPTPEPSPEPSPTPEPSPQPSPSGSPEATPTPTPDGGTGGEGESTLPPTDLRQGSAAGQFDETWTSILVVMAAIAVALVWLLPERARRNR
jgi:hypothetical protein